MSMKVADCPHCVDGHESPARCAWGVRVGPDRDGDGQPVSLIVQPTDGAHVGEADAEWLWQLIRNWRPSGMPRRERLACGSRRYHAPHEWAGPMTKFRYWCGGFGGYGQPAVLVIPFKMQGEV